MCKLLFLWQHHQKKDLASKLFSNYKLKIFHLYFNGYYLAPFKYAVFKKVVYFAIWVEVKKLNFGFRHTFFSKTEKIFS